MSNCKKILLASVCCLSITSAILNVIPSTSASDTETSDPINVYRPPNGLLRNAECDHSLLPHANHELPMIIGISSSNAPSLDHLYFQMSYNDLHTLAQMDEEASSFDVLNENKSPQQKPLVSSADSDAHGYQQQQQQDDLEQNNIVNDFLHLTGSIGNLIFKEKFVTEEIIHTQLDCSEEKEEEKEDDYYGVPSPEEYQSKEENMLKDILQIDSVYLTKHESSNNNQEIEHENESENGSEREKGTFQNGLDFITDAGDTVDDRLKNVKIQHELGQRNILPVTNTDIATSTATNTDVDADIGAGFDVVTAQESKGESQEMDVPIALRCGTIKQSKKENENENENGNKKDQFSLPSLSILSTLSHLLSSFKTYSNSFYSTPSSVFDNVNNESQVTLSLPLSLPLHDGNTASVSTSNTALFNLRGSTFLPPFLPHSLPYTDLTHPSLSTLSLPLTPSTPSTPTTPSLNLLNIQLSPTQSDVEVKNLNSRRKLQVRKKYIREDESNSDTENSLPLSSLFRSYFSASETEPLLSVPRKKVIAKKIKNKIVKSRLDSTVNGKKNAVNFTGTGGMKKDLSLSLGVENEKSSDIMQKKRIQVVDNSIKNEDSLKMIENKKEKNLNSGDLRNSDMNALFGLSEIKEKRMKKNSNEPILMSPFFEMKKIKNRNLKNERKNFRGNPRLKMNVESGLRVDEVPAIDPVDTLNLSNEGKVIEMRRIERMEKEFKKKLIRDKIVEEMNNNEKFKREKEESQIQIEKERRIEQMRDDLTNREIEKEVLLK
jgi:hypothetical protein